MRPVGDSRTRLTLSWSFLTVLGAGALLDSTSRVGVGPSLPLILGALGVSAALFAQAADGAFVSPSSTSTRVKSSLRRWWVQVAAVLTSMLLLTAEAIRFVRRGSHDGFPVWLSDLFHEDNSSWIMLGTSTATGTRLMPMNFGSGTALLQGAVNGLAVAFAWLRGLPPSAVGVSVMGVGFSYILLVAATPLLIIPICRLAWTRTGSVVGVLSVGASLLIFSLRFTREVRDLGHLTAGFTVFALLFSTLMLTSGRTTRRVAPSRAQALWAFSFSCLLWFPLRPLALVFATLALTDEVRSFPHALKQPSVAQMTVPLLRGAIFFVSVALRAIPDLSSYVSSESRATTRSLIAARGATYEPFDFFLLVTAVLVGVVLLHGSFGTTTERRVLYLLSSYAMSVRFLDRFTNFEFQYGSTKMLWIMLPVLVLLSSTVIVRDVQTERLRGFRLGGVAVSLGLLLANSTSYYGVVRSLGPVVWSDVAGSTSELDNPLATDEIVQWDEPGGLNLQFSPWELPTFCVMVDESALRPLPMWESEPYRCTRKVSYMSLEHLRNRVPASDSLEDLWKSYALMGSSLTATVVGSANSGNDLSRTVLLLDRDGAILRQEKTIDLFAQIALSDAVVVSVRPGWSEPTGGRVPHNVDGLDFESHRADLWVANDVVEVILISDRDSTPTLVDRTPREDVAELLGRDDLFSGLTIEHPAIRGGLRCIVLVNRQSEGTVAWSAGESCV